MYKLDRKDLGILGALMGDAQLSNRELARTVGLAESTTLERVRRLEEDGVILGSHVEIDLKAFGVHLQAMVMVRLNEHTRSVVETFQNDLLRLPEVLGVYLVSGHHDFMLHVAVRDADHLRELELGQITCRPEVTDVATHLIFGFERSHDLPARPED